MAAASASTSTSCSCSVDSCCDIPPLWGANNNKMHGQQLSSLDEQIRHFYHQIQPTEHDKLIRSAAFRRVRALVQKIWPNYCDLRPFGSYATGLYLPDADIDASIVHPTTTKNAAGDALQLLRLLVRHLRRLPDEYAGIDFRSAAKIPIVRFTDTASAIRFDISVRPQQQQEFEESRELQGVHLVTSAISEYPSTFPPLYLLLKAYLHHHRFNEVYRTGGLNSFMLFVMLKSFLDLHAAHCCCCCRNYVVVGSGVAAGGHGLGFLLLAFFHFYGACLKVKEFGVTCRKDRAAPLVSLRQLSTDGVTPPRSRYGEVFLGIEDPLHVAPGRNIGHPAFNFGAIRQRFYRTYNAVVTNYIESSSSDESPPLHTLILPDAASFRSADSSS